MGVCVRYSIRSALDNHCAVHGRVYRAVIGERTRLIECVLECRADGEVLGIPRPFVLGDGVRGAVLVRPCHRLTRRDRDARRREGEVRDGHAVRIRRCHSGRGIRGRAVAIITATIVAAAGPSN